MKLKVFLQIFVLFISLVFISVPTYAADINVSCTVGGCAPHTVTGLFNASTNWLPGTSVSKTIQVENATGMKQSVGLRTQNVSATGSVDTVLTMTIHQQNGNITIYSGSLETFFATPSFTLDTLDSAKNETYIFTIAMPSSVGNQYQSKNAAFDMLLSLTEIQPVADNSKNGGSSATSTTSTGTGITGQSSGGPQVLGLTSSGQSEEYAGVDTTVLGESTLSGILTPTQAVGELLGMENWNGNLRIIIFFFGIFSVVLWFVVWRVRSRFFN